MLLLALLLLAAPAEPDRLANARSLVAAGKYTGALVDLMAVSQMYGNTMRELPLSGPTGSPSSGSRTHHHAGGERRVTRARSTSSCSSAPPWSGSARRTWTSKSGKTVEIAIPLTHP